MAVEEFTYNYDGTIPTIMPTREGVKPVGTLDPYRRVEAETIADSRGLTTEQHHRTGVYVTDIHQGDWLKVAQVDMGDTSPRSITLGVASASQGGTVLVYADSIGGKPVAELSITPTGGWEEWQTVSANLSVALTGIHPIFFTFKGQKGRKLLNMDWWRMEK